MLTVEEIIIQKGLKIDMFDPFDQYFRDLTQFNEKTKLIALQIESNLKNEIKPKSVWDSFLPLDSKGARFLDVQFKDRKEYISDYTKDILQSYFKNLTFDDNAFKKFIRSQKTFQAREIINYIIKTYGFNEEYLSLVQLQNLVKNAITYEQIENGEINIVGKTGMKFITENTKQVKAISKFALIVLGKEYPSFAQGWKNPSEGDIYNDACIKTMHWYRGGNITVLFYDEEHLLKFNKAIYTPVDELFKKLFPLLLNDQT